MCNHELKILKNAGLENNKAERIIKITGRFHSDIMANGKARRFAAKAQNIKTRRRVDSGIY